jgi:hypothetical protein
MVVAEMRPEEPARTIKDVPAGRATGPDGTLDEIAIHPIYSNGYKQSNDGADILQPWRSAPGET